MGPQCKVLDDSNSFQKNDKTMTVLSNSQAFVKSMASIAGNVSKLLTSKAYLYQYEKYGLSQEDIVQSLASFEQVLFNYQSL